MTLWFFYILDEQWMLWCSTEKRACFDQADHLWPVICMVWPLLYLIWRTQTHKLPKQILHPTQNIWHFKRKTFFIYYSNAVDLTHCNTRSYIILQSNSVKLIVIYHIIYIIFQMAINPHTKLYVRYLKGQLDYRGYGWHFLH